MNKLYAVSGERNMGKASQIHGGLFVNIGQTNRTTKKRLKDKDYAKKSGC